MTTIRARRRFVPSFDLMPLRITPSDISTLNPMDPTDPMSPDPTQTPVDTNPMDPTNTLTSSSTSSTVVLADSTSTSLLPTC